MAQDNANEPTVAEESQASDQNHAKRVDSASAQPTAESQMADPAMDDTVEDVAEEEVDAEEEVETTETESPSQDATADGAPSSSATPPTQSAADTDADERCEIEKQPYDFDHCTVQIAIQLLPHDGGANGRMVVVGVRSHLDTPILRLLRLNELGPLPQLVNELLDALKAELPAREQAAREAFEKKKEEKAKRKAGITASKTSRGKKTQATLSTAPASSSTTIDNRPRPEVQATTAPQQQMGLF